MIYPEFFITSRSCVPVIGTGADYEITVKIILCSGVDQSSALYAVELCGYLIAMQLNCADI